jgi:hypothetical protein
MISDIRKWILSGSLAGTLVFTTGAAAARAQNPYEAPPGSRADQREDWREARRLNWQTRGDAQHLRSDMYQFGRHSPEARADRERLRYDRQRRRALRRDIRHDRRAREYREDHWR